MRPRPVATAPVAAAGDRSGVARRPGPATAPGLRGGRDAATAPGLRGGRGAATAPGLRGGSPPCPSLRCLQRRELPERLSRSGPFEHGLSRADGARSQPVGQRRQPRSGSPRADGALTTHAEHALPRPRARARALTPPADDSNPGRALSAPSRRRCALPTRRPTAATPVGISRGRDLPRVASFDSK
jgi:hypothetical protein